MEILGVEPEPGAALSRSPVGGRQGREVMRDIEIGRDGAGGAGERGNDRMKRELCATPEQLVGEHARASLKALRDVPHATGNRAEGNPAHSPGAPDEFAVGFVRP